jgi:hypothetical protein
MAAGGRPERDAVGARSLRRRAARRGPRRQAARSGRRSPRARTPPRRGGEVRGDRRGPGHLGRGEARPRPATRPRRAGRGGRRRRPRGATGGPARTRPRARPRPLPPRRRPGPVRTWRRSSRRPRRRSRCCAPSASHALPAGGWAGPGGRRRGHHGPHARRRSRCPAPGRCPRRRGRGSGGRQHCLRPARTAGPTIGRASAPARSAILADSRPGERQSAAGWFAQPVVPRARTCFFGGAVEGGAGPSSLVTIVRVDGDHCRSRANFAGQSRYGHSCEGRIVWLTYLSVCRIGHRERRRADEEATRASRRSAGRADARLSWRPEGGTGLTVRVQAPAGPDAQDGGSGPCR